MSETHEPWLKQIDAELDGELSLVERAAANIDAEKAARTAERMRKGQFDLTDMREQLMQMASMGGISGLMGMMPGVAKMKNQIAAAGIDDKIIKRQVAVIDSMTRQERKNPDILKASRKKRIAACLLYTSDAADD